MSFLNLPCGSTTESQVQNTSKNLEGFLAETSVLNAMSSSENYIFCKILGSG